MQNWTQLSIATPQSWSSSMVWSKLGKSRSILERSCREISYTIKCRSLGKKFAAISERWQSLMKQHWKYVSTLICNAVIVWCLFDLLQRWELWEPGVEWKCSSISAQVQKWSNIIFDLISKQGNWTLKTISFTMFSWYCTCLVQPVGTVQASWNGLLSIKYWHLLSNTILTAFSHSRTLHSINMYWDFQVSLSFPNAPCPCVKSQCSQHMWDGDCWFSPPFQSAPGGYKLCLNVRGRQVNGALNTISCNCTLWSANVLHFICDLVHVYTILFGWLRFDTAFIGRLIVHQSFICESSTHCVIFFPYSFFPYSQKSRDQTISMAMYDKFTVIKCTIWHSVHMRVTWSCDVVFSKAI